MKLISWNANGIRALSAKPDFEQFFKDHNPDILCLQETKAQEHQLEEHHYPSGDYHTFFHSAEKKGYSGVAIFAKKKPLNVIEGIGVEEFDCEGRVLTFEYEDFFILSVYVPNAQHGLARIEYRKKFNDEFLKFVNKLKKKKGVIICGDLNVAHNEIDLKNPKANRQNPGFSDEEREKFNELLDAGYVDTFRHFYPQEIKYTWWSYRFNARARNIGWRIDYFVVNKEFTGKIKDAFILDQVKGSDHCPVGIVLK